MSTQILRVETRDGLNTNLLNHVAGVVRPAIASTNDRGCVSLRSNVAHAREVLAEHRSRPKRRGRQSKPICEMLLAGPPPFSSTDAWTDEQVARWADDSTSWFEMTFPHAVVVEASLHLDETSPHIHLLFIPRTSRDEISWSKLLPEAMALQYERSSISSVSKAGTKLQDTYQAEVARHFDLARGEVGSKKRHREIDRAAGMDRAIEAAKEEAMRDIESDRQALAEEREQLLMDRRSLEQKETLLEYLSEKAQEIYTDLKKNLRLHSLSSQIADQIRDWMTMFSVILPQRAELVDQDVERQVPNEREDRDHPPARDDDWDLER